jgi:mRNA interferase YafQ
MNLIPVYTTTFNKDFKRLEKRGVDLEKLRLVITLLLAGTPLDEQFRDHPLRGKYTGARDCHIGPDWVLIYAVVDDDLRLIRTGSHTDLFK